MRAFTIQTPGPHGKLVFSDTPLPLPGPGEVRLHLHASGINRADLYQLQGLYPGALDLPPIPGLEAAGTVEALGEGVTTLALGDRVTALLPGGGYAEKALASAALCLPLPDTMEWSTAAALPEALFTVWMSLFHYGHLRTGESVLIYGGSSGIGTIAIQCARHWGATVYATASTPEKAALCETLGATPLLYTQAPLSVQLPQGVDVILDMAGGDSSAENLKLAKQEGRIITIALQAGAEAQIKLSHLFSKQLTWRGALLRRQSPAMKQAFAEAIRTHFWPLAVEGKIFPVIDSVFALQDAPQALEKMRMRSHMGKIILCA